MNKHKYIAAVSGGVDSTVLLDMLATAGYDVVVAHFDHGIRPDSHRDSALVEAQSRKYGFSFVSAKGKLGPDASEEAARNARYAFLRNVAKKYKGRIVTAHHRDDVIETIILHIQRGSGWRGIGVMGASDISRPLLGMSKKELIKYAIDKQLRWREDSTNDDQKYARNRIRTNVLPKINEDARIRLHELRTRQVELAHEIDKEMDNLLVSAKLDDGYSRHFFTMTGDDTSTELIRRLTVTSLDRSITRPQAIRAVHAIKVGRPDSTIHIGSKVNLLLGPRSFSIR